MDPCHFNQLPDELLLDIFAHYTDLNAQPPSTWKFSLAPDEHLTESSEQPLKTISLVSSRWLRILRPILFQNARITLPSHRAWTALCNGLRKSLDLVSNKSARVRNIINMIDQKSTLEVAPPIHDDRILDFVHFSDHDDHIPSYYLHWFPGLSAETQGFFNFVRESNLVGSIKSLVVYCHEELPQERSNAVETFLYSQVRSLWCETFRTLALHQIIVAAPPSTIAALSGGYEKDWDDWLFRMPYHYLRLQRNASISSEALSSPDNRARQIYLYNIAQWSRISYNEGTFLRGYGHYEYHWMRPPYIFAGILDRLVKDQTSPKAPKIESVEYISAFPYRSHVDHVVAALAGLKHIRELKVSLANPDLLENKELLGKGQPSDVYNEWEGCYVEIRLRFLEKAREGLVFIAEDLKHATLQEQIRKCMQRGLRQMKESEMDLGWTVQ